MASWNSESSPAKVSLTPVRTEIKLEAVPADESPNPLVAGPADSNSDAPAEDATPEMPRLIGGEVPEWSPDRR